jgi:hypothetical protein
MVCGDEGGKAYRWMRLYCKTCTVKDNDEYARGIRERVTCRFALAHLHTCTLAHLHTCTLAHWAGLVELRSSRVDTYQWVHGDNSTRLLGIYTASSEVHYIRNIERSKCGSELDSST